MSKTLSDIAKIVRKATARIDQSISDTTIYGYINDFYSLEMGQDMRLFDENGFYEFDLVASTDTYSVSLDADTGIGFSLLTGPVWVDGYATNLYISPDLFYAKWPETQDCDERRPDDVLWHNRELIFRPTPDDAYSVKIGAYKTRELYSLADTPTGSESIGEDYWWRYIAYGAAIDLLADAGEFEKVAQLNAIFEKYKALVNARSYSQYKNKIIVRNF